MQIFFFFLNVLAKLPITILMAKGFPVVCHFGRLNLIENLFNLNGIQKFDSG
jgi:hypothetical protein